MRFTKNLLLVACLIGLFGILGAQEMGERVALHFQIEPKAGMHQQFETALRAHTRWRKEQNDPWQWYVMQVVAGRDYGDYIIRSDEIGWADLDAYSFRDKGYSHFISTVGPFIESINSSITATNQAVSHWPEDLMPRIVAVEVFSLKPGKAEQFWQTVAKAHQAFKGRMGAYAWETVAVGQGAGGSEAVLVLPMKSWSEMKPRNQEMMGYFREAYGEEGTRELMGKFDDCLSGMESMVVAVRRDLSLIRQQ